MAERKKTNRKIEGFTLVEIMIVVAIIGVLAVLAIPAFARARVTSQQGHCVNNIRIIADASELRMMETGQMFPPGLLAGLVPTYIKRTPVCPTGGTYFFVFFNNTAGHMPGCTIGGGHAL